MNQLFVQLGQFLSQYSIRQRIVIFTVAIGFISAIIAMIVWANRPEFELLYSNLEPTSASSIVAELRNEKIPYQLENSGRTIYVPREQVAEMRLKFAKSGFIKDGVTGYEIFENSNMGMTTFMQRVNMRRALEGELTRTINQFPEVAGSRVHLVLPENRLFEEDKKGSASVVLFLKPGYKIDGNQISGIAALVANSVKGIEAENVVILDTKGKLLSEKSRDSGVLGVVGNQWQLQHAVESELQLKVTDIVEGIVGFNNTVVRVTAELNFDQIERTKEAIDPDNVAVVSEERYTENTNSQLDSSNMNAEKVLSNYEIGRTKEKYVSNAGNVKRLTVAVLVNGKYELKEDPETGEPFREYTPRSEQELKQIEALVKSAVGFNENRGDVVEVRNLRFDDTVIQQDDEYYSDLVDRDFWEQLLTRGLIGIGLLLAFFMIKGMLKTNVSQLFLPATAAANRPGLAGASVHDSLPEAAAAAASALGEGSVEEEMSEDVFMKKLSPEARAKLKAQDKMTEEVVKFAQANPEDASMILRTWLMEDTRA